MRGLRRAARPMVTEHPSGPTPPALGPALGGDADAAPGYPFDGRLHMADTDREHLAARVAAIRPTGYVEWQQTGIDLLLLGRYEDALDHLDRALELADTERRRVAVLINLGDVYRYQGDAVTAEILYRQALDLARTDVPEALSFALQHLGTALAEQHRLDEARTLLAEALALRSAEADSELVESTCATLDALDELPIALPPVVAALLGAAPVWSDDHEGLSGGVSFVNGAYWVKRGPLAVSEHARLNWLRDYGIRLPDVAVFDGDVLVLADAGAPSLASRAEDNERAAAEIGAAADGGFSEGRAYAADASVRSDEVPGGYPAEATGTVGALMGALLRSLHSIPIAECPFDGRLDSMLTRAARRVLHGLIDPEDFDEDHEHLVPEQILDRLHAQRPDERDLVVAHGDFTPSNVLEGGILIDVGDLGVADRYRDLALAERDLREDFGADEVRAFFTAYGLDEPDRRRLDYYRLLDELF
ncbi:phosphotransferase [Nocardia sp. NPDC057440]|uniref:phosphotransferase n=1 Tax=Nocardia sp. NPDC057440 TaxID=3346134 RepID=UPI00366E566D